MATYVAIHTNMQFTINTESHVIFLDDYAYTEIHKMLLQQSSTYACVANLC